jgi:hypothetical protein
MKTKVWLQTDEGMRFISHEEGVPQGDILGSLLFCLGAHPFYKKIDEIVKKDCFTYKWIKKNINDYETVEEFIMTGLTKAYIDDLNLACSHETLIEATTYIINEGPKIGLVLNKNKTKVLLGKCGSLQIALKHQQDFLELGLLINNIMINPDDVDEELQNDFATKYGLECLGAPIGHRSFIKRWTSDKDKEYQKCFDSLSNFSSEKQCCYQLLTQCLLPKLNYSQRLICPELMTDTVERFQDNIKNIALNLMGKSNISELAYEQARLPVNCGGIGLQNLEDTSETAFVASILACNDEIKKAFPFLEEYTESYNNKQIFEGKLVPTWDKCCMILYKLKKERADLKEKLKDYPFILEDIPDMEELHNVERKALQNFLSNPRKIKRAITYFSGIAGRKLDTIRYLSGLGKAREATHWLNALPRCPDMMMTNDEWSIAVLRKLGESIPLIPPDRRCGCNKFIDTNGMHILQCGINGTTINQHNQMQETMRTFFRAMGLRTEMEPHIGFNGDRGDLRIFQAPGKNKELILDIKITNPLASSNQTSSSDRIPGVAAAQGSKMKKASYAKRNLINKETNEELTSGRWTLLPVIFEHFGALNDESLTLIKEVVEQGSHRLGIPEHILHIYWLKRLGISLQKTLARSILYRSLILCSTDITKSDFSTSIGFMATAENTNWRIYESRKKEEN